MHVWYLKVGTIMPEAEDADMKSLVPDPKEMEKIAYLFRNGMSQWVLGR